MAQVVSFKEALISIPDVLDFYSLDSITVPETRPYAWTMSVSSLDGLLSFREPGALGAHEIAMAHIKDSGSLSDWRLLNGGWMIADAVLGTGLILKAEPGIKWIPHFEDMANYRVNVLKKSKSPLAAVLSGSGDVDLSHPMFHDPDIHAVLFTSKVGHSKLSSSEHLLEGTNTKIEVVGETPVFGGDDLRKVYSLLFDKYNVKLLDVTAGGVAIGALAWHKLVDEMRVTVSGQLVGGISTTGEKRPPLFPGPPGDACFTHMTNPLLKNHKIGTFGFHHIFVRALVQYRHEIN